MFVIFALHNLACGTAPEVVAVEFCAAPLAGRSSFSSSFANACSTRAPNRVFRQQCESLPRRLPRCRTIKFTSDSGFVHKSNLAESLAELGQTDEALKLFREVLAYDSQRFAADAANQEVK